MGARARACTGEIYEVLRSTGCTADKATGFIAYGMLLNVMLGMRAPEPLHDSHALADLTASPSVTRGSTRPRRHKAE